MHDRRQQKQRGDLVARKPHAPASHHHSRIFHFERCSLRHRSGHPLRLKSCRGISKSLRQHGCSRYPVSLHNADMADCARYNNLTRRLARTGYCSLNFADSFRRSTKVEVAPRSFRRSTLHAIIVRAVPSMGHHAGRCRADNAWKTTVLKIARQFDRKQHWAFERLLALRISSTGRDRGRPR